MGHPDAWWIADHAVPAIALGLAIAKLGCFGSGCCVGCATTRNLSVTYSHPLSKAVAFYGLAGIPLLPLQLYESATGLATAVGFFLLPENWFGEGRILGLFLVTLSIQRTVLLPFRYRFPGARADALIGSTLHLVFVTIGAGLTVAPPGTFWAASHESGTSTVAFAWGLLAAVILVLLMFGAHRMPKLAPRPNTRGGKS
jgi:prolipoprotein diacylglyceryltransferase